MEKEDIELLEEIDDIQDLLEIETLTEEDCNNLEALEQVANLCVFTFPIFGACYALSNFHSVDNFVTAALSLGAGFAANSFSKNAGIEYNPKSKYNQKLRKLRKRFAPILLAFNIVTMTISGLSIVGKPNSKLNINKTGMYSSCKVLENFHSDVNTIFETLEYSISNNLLLNDLEREQIRRLYPYFEDNKYLDFLKVYHNLNTIDIFYLQSTKAKKEKMAAGYIRDTNEIIIYNGASIEDNLPHEIVHSTGYLNIRFLNEGMTSIIVSEYCFKNGNIRNGYIPEIYLTYIVTELVGKDTMLEAYSTENTDLVVQKLLENSDVETVHNLLDKFEELCLKHRNREEENEQSQKEYFVAYEGAKEQLIIYLNQKLPSNTPQNMLEQIARKARIYDFFKDLELNVNMFIPRFYYIQTSYTAALNVSNTLTFEEAMNRIEEFEESNQSVKHLE